MPDSVVEDVRADLLRRSEVGLKKYGVTVADNPLPLRDWLQHAYEETLDKAVYLRRAILEIDRAGAAPMCSCVTEKSDMDTQHRVGAGGMTGECPARQPDDPRRAF